MNISPKKITYKMLEILSEGLFTSVEVFLTIMLSPYGSSMSSLDYNQEKISKFLDNISEEFYNETFGKIKERRNFYKLISKLKKEGIIIPKENKWKITQRGLVKLGGLRKLFSKQLPKTEYKIEPENTVKIVTFDVPEKLSKKRDWLRERLKYLDFKMLQKSVWIGKNKIPEEFMGELKKLNILQFTEIMIITRTGTIKKY